MCRVCTVQGLYCAECVLCRVCSVQGVYCTGCVVCRVCTVQACLKVAPVEEVVERQERLLAGGCDTPSPAPQDNFYKSCVKGEIYYPSTKLHSFQLIFSQQNYFVIFRTF